MKKIISIIFTISLIASYCLIPAHAYDWEDIAGTVSGIEDGLQLGQSILDLCESIGIYWDGDNPEDFGTWYCTFPVAYSRILDGRVTNYTLDDLSAIVRDWNGRFGYGVDSTLPYAQYFDSLVAEAFEFEDTGYCAIRVRDTDQPDAQGIILTYYDGTVIGAPIEEEDVDLLAGHWGARSSLNIGSYRMLTYEDLYNLAVDVGGHLRASGNHWFIYEPEHGAQVYCSDLNGYPFAAPYKEAAVEVPRPSTTVKDENGNEVTVPGDTSLDFLNGLLTVFGDVLEIDQLIYDEGTKTYYIDASSTTNITNNYYFKWEYHINHTSITYIGQTEQYDKYYEVYYELPDGRDSADLTKEEIEQLNLSVDVIPYSRSTENPVVRSLYHFDGDTSDSSYWNYLTGFDWVHGASLTYMDAGVFNGALYLDENLHNFNIMLPSSIGSGNFTLQFRYYQSATPAPVTDSSIRFEGTEGSILRWDGGALYDIRGDRICTLPTGSWNEIAISRYRYATRYYLNGVCVREIADRSIFGDEIEFTFGSQQQTYKYIDELRVMNAALDAEGADYIPTSVPYDTNLSLVLPTDKVAVADEYWEFDTTIAPVFTANMSTGNPPIVSTYGLGSFTGAGLDINVGMSSVSFTGQSGDSSFPISIASSAIGMVSGSIPSPYGLILPLNHHSYIYFNGNIVSDGSTERAFPDGSYTFTMVDSSGNCYSHYIDSVSASSIRSNSVISFSEFDWGRIEYRSGFISLYENGYRTRDATLHYIAVVPNDGQTIDFVYSELVSGDTPNTGHEFHSAVAIFDEDDLNTPTLAVRTDLDITSYQIGGVRPSVPQKGQVWALVEGQRIKSLQIYNGQAWESVSGRIWTGQRWVPYSSYNIITLQDLFDVHDVTQDFEYIYTEQGFWDWWQKSWNEFTTKLFNALGGGSSSDPSKLPTDGTEAPENNGQKFKHFIIVLRDGFWSICVGLADAAYGGFEGFADSVSTVGSFFTSYGSGEDSIWLLPLEEGVTIWD